MNFPLVAVNNFTPNNSGWNTVGQIDRFIAGNGNRRFTFFFGTRSLFIEILGPLAFRLRFNPAEGSTYDLESSTAVVSRDLGTAGLVVASSTPSPGQLVLDTGAMRLEIDLTHFGLKVFRGQQLIHQDFPGKGVLYIPSQEVVAVMKSAPPGARYVGGGEKAGAQLFKNNLTFTYFNYDNFMYSRAGLNGGNPLNPTVPLYCSIPFLIELLPKSPGGPDPYAYGIFLDNTGQTFINVTANDYSDMSGKYYMGGLYNELDYYFMAGHAVGEVLGQYTTLTGRAPMPPKYVFGFHQGAYGYFDHIKLSAAATAYRNARIPCDGLHIDVDFQDNYRTFTHSETKFPNCSTYFASLHQQGFKMSTNITPLLTDNSLAENGRPTPYVQSDNLKNAGGLLNDSRAGAPASANLFDCGVNYGANMGSNPYVAAYPPLKINEYGLVPLASPGHYPNFGLATTRRVWGEQYQHLIVDLGLDMIWQDMTCPALDPSRGAENFTFPGDLMMAREMVDSTGAVTVEMLPNAKLHNSYVLNLLKATYDGVGALRPAQRNFIIARGGFAGMQRYAGLWTGDSASSWDFLAINLPEVLNLGLSGVPVSGCDIGGFAKGSGSTLPDTDIAGTRFQNGVVTGAITNYELFTRWMQLGSFLPWFRNHYDGYNKGFQEAFAYGEPVPTNCRRYVELRYRMMQVYYDAMYQCTQTGMPIARALFLNDPDDPQVYSHCDDQFFVGGDVLVAPIISQHETASPPTDPRRQVYLPAHSSWYSFMDNLQPLEAAVLGGTTVPEYFAGLDRVPIYIRAGAILPFCELEQWVGELPANPLTFNCYPGPDRWSDDAAYQVFQDDGISAGGASRISRVYQRTVVNGASVVREVRVARVQGAYVPRASFFNVAILGSVTPPHSVMRDGVALANAGTGDNLSNGAGDGWYWNASLQIAFAKVVDNTPDTSLSFNY